ncbi:BAR domain-containing protein [Aquimarina algicola]|uniref:Uncharacterized protein n=1 Tax=Aquimarina algicola TaxID=2589995 RepID=A0A504JC01_9FLAO|nr:hypothetical protein [Aquimarina algicola]TPN86082.1 hypothetical protein FHK87_12475 [Aquimarina algicola]
MRSLLLSFFFLIIIKFGQAQKSFSILGNTYKYEYKETEQKFKIIKIESNNDEFIHSKDISPDSFSGFSSAIRGYFNNQEFYFLSKKFKIKDISKVGIENEIENGNIQFKDLPNEDKILDTGTFEIVGMPKKFRNFKYITIKNEGSDDHYTIENKNLNISINNIEELSSSKIKENLISPLKTKSEEILAQIKAEFYVHLSEFDKFYDSVIKKSPDYTFLETEVFEDTAGNSHNISVFYLEKEETISLKLIKVSDQSNLGIGVFKTTWEIYEFKESFFGYFNFPKNTINNLAIERILALIKQNKSTSKLLKEKKEAEKSLKEVIEKFDNEKTNYSGRIVVNKKFNLYNQEPAKEKVKVKKCNWWVLCLCKKEIIKNKYVSKISNVFMVDHVNITFFNNRIDELSIEGRFESHPDIPVSIKNDQYSLTLKDFRNRTQTDFYRNNELAINGKFYYGDVLSFLSLEDGSDFNTAIKNGSIKVSPGSPVKVESRDIYDYFTGVIFSDFLGFNPNNSNSLLVAEGMVRIPLNRYHKGKRTYLDNLTISGSANIVGNTENNALKIELEDIQRENPEDFKLSEENFSSNNFDLLRYNNTRLGIKASLVTYELKTLKSFLHLRYGLELVRTRFDFNLIGIDSTTVDSEIRVERSLFAEKSFQIFSIGQEVDLNIEIRPQSKYFGADISFGINWFGETGGNDVNFRAFNNTPNLKLMGTVYATPKKSKNGLFLRLGAYYNLGDYESFPQLMIGYAANLSSFINKGANQ